VNTVMNFWLP